MSSLASSQRGKGYGYGSITPPFQGRGLSPPWLDEEDEIEKLPRWRTMSAACFMLLVLATCSIVTVLAVNAPASPESPRLRSRRRGLTRAWSLNEEVSPTPENPYKGWSVQYDTRYLDVQLDHFGFEATTPNTFPLRYLVSDQFYNKSKGGGAILLYAGNEGSIEDLARETGMLWHFAPQLGGLVVFAEHRFYGASVPLPETSTAASSRGYQNPLFRYLTAEQAMADYASLIQHLRQTHGADTPVLVFGGSYGGMLAAWMREKYTHLVDGAVASSAPVALLRPEADPTRLHLTAATAYQGVSTKCSQGLRDAFEQLWEASATRQGREGIAKGMNLCRPLATRYDAELLVGRLQQVLVRMAEVNYPYARYGLPGRPVAEACARFEQAVAKQQQQQQQSQMPLLGALGAAVSVGLEGRRQRKEQQQQQQPKPSTCLEQPLTAFEQSLPGMLPGAWTYQRCSELVFPVAVGEDNPVFLPCSSFQRNCWSPATFQQFCQQQYGVSPRPEWAPLAFSSVSEHSLGLGDVIDMTNIVFTNGGLDPWMAGGLLPEPPFDRFKASSRTNLASSHGGVVKIMMDGAAHHLDLRSPHPNDPRSVSAARVQQLTLMREWIEDKKLAAKGL